MSDTAVQKTHQAVGDGGECQAVLKTEHGKGFRLVAEATYLSPAETTRSGSAGAAGLPLIAELERCDAFRVAAAYGIADWLLAEVASVALVAGKKQTLDIGAQKERKSIQRGLAASGSQNSLENSDPIA